MKYLILAFLLGITILTHTQAQGKLLLVGGGAEDYNDWSDAPYQWLVEQSENKRVAIITFDESDQWLCDYFTSLGANYADTFWIYSSQTADLQSTYDSLITYDAIFMRGGDQQNYYETYVNTKTQEALQFVYNNGGVVGGTSAGMALLGDVAFTAQAGSVYPDECIQNPRLSFITLKDDFLFTLNNWIFDTHFIERGRLGRLAAFMENWYIHHNQSIQAIGVDDNTAVGIIGDSMAYVFGTGTANIIQYLDSLSPFDTVSSSMVKTQKLILRQLPENCSLNLLTDEVNGLTEFCNTSLKEETAMYYLLLSGSDEINKNHHLFDYLLDSMQIEENILIITGNNTVSANAAQTYLANNGAQSINTLQTLAINQNDPQITELITNASAYIFVDNTIDALNNFLNGGTNGNILNSNIRKDNAVVVLIGSNAHFAGTSVINNAFTDASASYYGDFEFSEGLNLLKASLVMPKTYEQSTDYYENIISGLPYLMVEECAKYGVWIPRESFIKYYYTNDLKPFIRYIDGSYPAMMLINNGTHVGYAGYWSPPRNIAGFESMNYYFLTHNDSIQVGTNVVSSINQIKSDEPISISPNPVENIARIEIPNYQGTIQLIDEKGILHRTIYMKETINKDFSNLAGGIYFIKTEDQRLLKMVKK